MNGELERLRTLSATQVEAIRRGYHKGAVLVEPSPEYTEWLNQCSLALRMLLHIADVLLVSPAEPGLLRITNTLRSALTVAPEIRERMQRYETGRNDETDSFYIAATDRTVLISQIDRAISEVAALAAPSEPRP